MPTPPSESRPAIFEDRRLRTAPHGDALDTSVRPDPLAQLRMVYKTYKLRHVFDHAADIADELAAFRPHAYQLRFMDNPRGILRVPRLDLNAGHFRRLWWEETGPQNRREIWATDNEARLTPGALKLAGARIMAGPGGDVAQAMADQIDFEWESRRWAEPPGDAEASSNGMGC